MLVFLYIREIYHILIKTGNFRDLITQSHIRHSKTLRRICWRCVDGLGFLWLFYKKIMDNHHLGITAFLNVVAYILWRISDRWDITFPGLVAILICIGTTIWNIYTLISTFKRRNKRKNIDRKTRIHCCIQLFVSMGIILVIILT